MPDFPTQPPPAAMEVKSLSPTLVSVSHSLKRQRRSRGGHRWGFELTYDKREKSEFLPLWSFLVAQRGQLEAFTFVPFAHSEATGDITTTPKVQGSYTSGTVISITDVDASLVGALKAGDFIKFANHSKVYMVTADVDSDAGGLAIMNITPPLQEAVPDTTEIIYDNVEFTCTLSGDQADVSVQSPLFYGLKIEMVEV